MIDSHCHIGFDTSPEETAAVIARAQAQGVEKMLTVACDFSSAPHLQKLLQVYPQLYGAFGIHPENAIDFDETTFLDVFEKMPDLVAVGEIGLDYYYNNDTQDIQKQVFLKQLELAARLNKPVIIHTRDAEQDTLDILQTAARNGWLKAGGVLHCYTGSLSFAEKAIAMGFYISASGILTFPKASDLRDVFSKLPPERLLIETDSPYLAPVPFRGKQNEPAYLPNTLLKLAEIKGMPTGILSEITTCNFNTLFRISNEN